MKITKENFEKVLLETMWERKNSVYNLDVVELTLQRLTGKVTNTLVIIPPGNVAAEVMDEVTPEDAKIYQDFFQELKSTIPHEVLGSFISVRGAAKEDADTFSTSFIDRSEGLSKNCNLVVANKTWVCEDMVLIISQQKVTKEVCYDIIDRILYTEDSIDAAKDIWMKYSELALEVYNNRIKEPDLLYQVETVGTDKDGCYFTKPLNIYPLESINDPDFLCNYNTDLPDKQVHEFLKMDRGGICIFNGTPGCGKSTYIKSLIFKNPGVHFIILPQYLLLNQEAFRMFLLGTANEGNRVFIIEDCEQLLVQREENGVQFASVISDILNYTSGVISDITCTKFIFTFNTDLTKIDKALLRRGRLKVKYEFMPLKGENLEKIAAKTRYILTDENKKDGVSLADLYANFEEVELGETKKRKKIGFVDYEDCEDGVVPYEDAKCIGTALKCSPRGGGRILKN